MCCLLSWWQTRVLKWVICHLNVFSWWLLCLYKSQTLWDIQHSEYFVSKGRKSFGKLVNLLYLRAGDLCTTYRDGAVLVCSSGGNKVPQMRQLKQQKCIPSQFWRLEVQDQGVTGLVPSEASLLGWEMPPSPCVLTRSSLCVCLCPHLFLQGHKCCWIRVQLNDLILLHCLCKDPTSKHSHNLRSWG